MKNTEQTECKRSGRSSKVVRVDLDLIDQLAHLSDVTRTPIKDIASKAIRFALQHAVTKPIECFDVEFVINKEQ